MRKNIIIFVSAAIMIFAYASLFGQYERCGYGRWHGDGRGHYREHGYERGYGRRHGYERGHGRVYYNNSLTSAQIDEIRTIKDKYYHQMDTLRMEIYNQRQNINTEMRKENPDENFINSAIDAKSKASADLQKLRIQCFLEIDKVYQNK